MPLTDKGRKVLAEMQKQYGEKKGENVFYASINKGTVKGAEMPGAGKGKEAKAPRKSGGKGK